jgi:16S rRNA (uracil1498-N3)-methyltransferase
VERHDRAAVASFFTDATLLGTSTVLLGDGPAHHARVKRLETGDAVRLTNGQGAVARGSIAAVGRRELTVEVESVDAVAPPSPIHVRVPIADRDRMLWLAEKAAELGIASWQPVRFRRSASVSPRGEGPAFEEKVRARMIGALEQSGGAWLPRMLPETAADSLIVESDQSPIVLDVDGPPLGVALGASGGRAPVLLFGPEGGIEPGELARLVDGGWRAARVATATLRFETAGVAAIAVCRNTLLATEN